MGKFQHYQPKTMKEYVAWVTDIRKRTVAAALFIGTPTPTALRAMMERFKELGDLDKYPKHSIQIIDNGDGTYIGCLVPDEDKSKAN